MVKNVVILTHWTPDIIEELYHDAVDYHGLEYWSDVAIERKEAIEKAASGNK